jgi:hypothetical protein
MCGRQAADERAVEDGVMPILVAAVLTMSAAQLLDLATFMSMIRQVGPAAEANPLVAVLFGAYGFPMVAIAKVVLLAIVSGIAAILATVSANPRLVGTVVSIAILVGVIGGLSNAIAAGAVENAIQRVGPGGP